MGVSATAVLANVQQLYPDLFTVSPTQEAVLVVPLANLLETLTRLRQDPDLGFNFLMDLTIVDYLTHPVPRKARFEVVYQLFALESAARLRVKAAVQQAESIPSVIGLWAAADWAEREAWEMYGLKFDGHTNLRRLLTHKDFVGYPLRKDYPAKKRQPLNDSDTLLEEMEQRLVFKGLKTVEVEG
jgi:NADH/F420H2 dehydrogenase subunit C